MHYCLHQIDLPVWKEKKTYITLKKGTLYFNEQHFARLIMYFWMFKVENESILLAFTHQSPHI